MDRDASWVNQVKIQHKPYWPQRKDLDSNLIKIPGKFACKLCFEFKLEMCFTHKGKSDLFVWFIEVKSSTIS